MPEITLKYPEVTAETWRAMREFTGAQSDARVIQDALRMYEWILYEQACGREVCARGSGKRYCLESFIAEAVRPRAVEFFENAEPFFKKLHA